MGLIINDQPINSAITCKKQKRSGHTKAKVPTISLHEPGRLRVGHVLALFSLSHSALYARLRNPNPKHSFPQPDGRDPRPWWSTATIKKQLEV